jgi:hypothetical protein
MVGVARATIGGLEVILVSVALTGTEITRACLKYNDSNHEKYTQRYRDGFN